MTFSRRAAAELRARITEALTNGAISTVGIEVRTFHGFASRLLQGDGARFKSRRLLDGFTHELLFDAALRSCAMPSISTAGRQSRSFRSAAARLIDDIDRAPAGAVASIKPAASPRLADLLRLRAAFAASRERLGASDLNDLVARAAFALADPNSEASRWLGSHRYEHVLVDEFQDTDMVQLDLLYRLGAALFTVGDEAQSIYRFRGAQHGVVALAHERFAMKHFALTVSRRCPPAVCDLAAATPFVQAESLRSAKTGGSPVVIHGVRTTADEVHLVADRIEAALETGTPPSQIAVLLRTTRPFGPLLADELRHRSIPVAESGQDALLSDSRISTLRAAFDVLAAPADEAAWRRLLTSKPLGFNPLAVRLAHAAIAAFRPTQSLAELLDAARLQSALLPNNAIAAALADANALWGQQELGRAARLLARRFRLCSAIMRSERAVDIRAAASRLTSVCDGLAQAQRALATIGQPATCADVVSSMDDHLSALAGETATDSQAVRILSVHGAKGLEFELVIIADAVDGRFPQAARTSNLLSDDDLALCLRHGIDSASNVDAVEHEEASLWFVAVTRAKNELVITYAEEGLDGREQRPSRFLAGRAPLVRTAVVRGSLEIEAIRNGDSAWRSQLRSERRVAASPVLSAFASAGDGAFARLDDRPLPSSRTLSVTDLVNWLQCPRKLFYGTFLGIRSEASTAQTLGNALHAVLQRFHETERDFTTVTIGSADGWTTQLSELRRDVWITADFAEPAIRESTALFADRALASYAQHLEAQATATPFVVEANETRVEVPIGPSIVRGRIDRIDRRVADGKAMLVDYKSGGAKNIPFSRALSETISIWDAGDSAAGKVDHRFTAQLAFYAGAVREIDQFAYIYFRGKLGDRSNVVVDSTTLDGEVKHALDLLTADVRTHLSEPLRNGLATTLPVAAHRDACMFCNYTEICPQPPVEKR